VWLRGGFRCSRAADTAGGCPACARRQTAEFGHSGWQLSLDGREQAASEPLALPVRNDGEPAYLRDGGCAQAHAYTDSGHKAAVFVPPAGGEHHVVTELRRQLRQRLPQWWKVDVAVRLRFGDVCSPLQGQYLSGVLGSQHERFCHRKIMTRALWGPQRRRDRTVEGSVSEAAPMVGANRG